MMITGISFNLSWLWNDDQWDLMYFKNLKPNRWLKGSPLPRSDFETMINRISSTFIIWNWNSDQGDLIYLDLALEWWSMVSHLLWSWIKMMIKGISFNSIWFWNDDQWAHLYFDNLELKWWSSGFLLPRSRFGMMIKGISSTLII